MLFLPVLMAMGVLLYFAWPREPVLWPAALLTGLGLTGTVFGRDAVPRAAAVCVVSCALGFLLAGFSTWRAPVWDRLPRNATVISGTITEIDALPQGRRVTLRNAMLDGERRLVRKVRLRLRDTDPQALAPGDTMRVRALLQPPPAPAYPGGWDTQRDAFFSDMGGYGFAIGASIRLTAAATGAWQGFREAVAGRIMAGLPGERGAIAATLLTGLGAAIPATDRQAFQDSGLAHVLAVAGLHMGIVMGLVFTTIRTALAAMEYPALYWPTKRIAAVAALVAGAGYLELTGAHVPVLRSFAMAAMVTLGVLTGRRAMSIRTLAVAAVLLMLAAPQAVMSVSFQMSLSAVLALVSGYEALRPFLIRVRQAPGWARPFAYAAMLACTSFMAGTASLPFAAYHFGKAALFYVPANMAAVPLTAFWVMPCCVASLLLMPFGWESVPLMPAGWGIGALICIAEAVAGWPGAVLAMPHMPGWSLGLVAFGMAWLGLWRSRIRLAGLLPLAAGCVSPWLVRLPDVLVTPGAEAIAARVGGQVFAEKGKRAELFDAAAPALVWGRPAIPFPAQGGAAGCDGVGCSFTISGHRFVLARGTQLLDCKNAAAVLSVGRLGAGCNAPVMLDQETARITGSAEVFAGAGAVWVVTDRDVRGERPWVFRDRPALPPADTE